MPNATFESSSRRDLKTCLQVLPELGTGGVERGTIEIAKALVESGWRALVASSGGPKVHELERAGAQHLTLPLKTKNPLAIRENAHRLADLIKVHGIDLIHARSRAPAWSAFHASKETGCPLITTFHGVYSLGPFGIKKVYNRVMTRGVRVIAISDFIASHIEKEYGTDSARVRLIPRGVDLKQFDPKEVSAARIINLAKEWRLPDGGPVIALNGRLTSWKGQHLLIDALGHLQVEKRLPGNWRCLLIGPKKPGSSYSAALESRAKARGLAGHIQFIYDCADMAAAYMVTDTVVSASTRPEAFGRVVAEAQAMGRPVVAPAHGAAPEILVPGVTGWLFTPGDSVSLAKAIERAVSLAADERSQLAENARDHVAGMFGLTDMTQATLDVYDEVLNKIDNTDQAQS